jgi:hypothetical protein
MLDWGMKMSTYVVRQTDGLDDMMAEEALMPRLKAVRSSMRSIGNWAAGEYVETEDRLSLRDKLLENFRTILGENAELPTVEVLDNLLNQVDDNSNTQHQLVGKMIQLFANQH